MAQDWKKEERQYYSPGKEPVLVEVPAFGFFTIKGRGDPNGEAFARCVEALYAASYAVKMSPRKQRAPDGYRDYSVYPLEGLWDLSDEAKARGGQWKKDELVFTLMIRQPSFLDAPAAERLLEAARAEKKVEALGRVRFETMAEGPCVQMLHEGSYDSEPASFGLMERFAKDRGLARLWKGHREIYLSDARRTAPGKLRTVLRFRVGPEPGGRR